MDAPLPDLRARLPDWAQRPIALVAALAAVVVAGIVAYSLLRAPAAPAPRLTLPLAGASGGAAAGAGPAAPGGPSPPTTAAVVTVHAAGAVVSPGVYTVPATARVADVLTAAGGALPEADVNRLNDRGQSPLAGTVFKDEDAVVKTLLAHGADPTLGQPSAIDTARMFGKEHYLELFDNA